MSIFRHFAPVRAARDLRAFLSDRRPHELSFLLLAVAVTVALMWGFAQTTRVEQEYSREIIYVRDWREGRTDAEIIAQQKIDEAQRKADREKAIAAAEKRRAATQAEFKKFDEGLTAWGL